MFQIRKIKFWVDYSGGDIEELYITIADFPRDNPRIKEEIIAKIENEEEATKLYESEKKKLDKISITNFNECKGEELILEEIEEDGIFKGLGIEIDSYINGF